MPGRARGGAGSARRPPRSAPTTRNIAVPMTLICIGIGVAPTPHTNIGNVTVLPELRLVMMKSSNDSENASSAAPRMPGNTSGNVIRQNVCHSLAYRSMAACSMPRVHAREPRLDGDHHERQAEHDVGDQDRPETELTAEAGGHEQRQQGRAHHDLGRGHRQEDHQVRRRPPGEAVPHQREGHQRARARWRRAVASRPIWMLSPTASHRPSGPHGSAQLAEREAIELVGVARGRVVEAHQHDDGDRHEHVDEHEDADDHDEVVADPATRTLQRGHTRSSVPARRT